MASMREAIRLLNQGKSLSGWARRSTVAEVNRLAAELGVERRPTKAATVSALERAPRPGVVSEGVDRVLNRRGLKRWGKAARKNEVEEVARKLGIDPASTKAATVAAIEAGANRARTVQRQIRAFDTRRARISGRMLAVLQAERMRLREALEAIPSGQPPYVRLRSRIRAIDAFARRVTSRLISRLEAEARDIRRQALTHLESLTPVARKAAENALSAQEKLRLYEYPLRKFAADMRDRLVRQAALGHTDAGLAGARSHLARMGNRLELITRTESARIYNDAQVAAGEHASTERGERVYKRIVEVFDARNHPFSRAAAGLSVPVTDEFRVSASEVEKWGTVLRKSTGGIFWRLSGGFYVGRSLPAHWNDRGFIVVEVR